MNAPDSQSNPIREITRPAWHRVHWGLRAIVAIQSFGLGGRYLFSPHETESDIYGWLFFDCDWQESLAQQIDNVGAGLTVAMGCLVVMIGLATRRYDRNSVPRWMRWTEAGSAFWITIWMMTIAWTHMVRGGPYAEIAFAEQAVRYAAPFALGLIALRPQAPDDTTDKPHRFPRVAMATLALAASATFTAHGYKAIECYGPFTDLILLSDMNWTQLGIAQATANRTLVIIGVVDIVLAVLLIALRSRFALWYMAAWGFITATSRMSALGWGAWPETMVRVANGAVPITLLLLGTAFYHGSRVSSRRDGHSDNTSNAELIANDPV